MIFLLRIRKRVGSPGDVGHIELPVRVGQLHACFESYKPQVQCDSHLLKVLLIDRENVFRTLVVVEHLDHERLAILDETTLRISLLPACFGEQLYGCLGVVRILRIVRVFIDGSGVVGIRGHVLFKEELLDQKILCSAGT